MSLLKVVYCSVVKVSVKVVLLKEISDEVGVLGEASSILLHESRTLRRGESPSFQPGFGCYGPGG